MSIVELGAIGEFIGAIVLVVTLVYLAIQIRQTSKLQKLAMRQIITKDSASLTELQASSVILNSGLTKLFHSNERLTDTEMMAYGSFLTAF